MRNKGVSMITLIITIIVIVILAAITVLVGVNATQKASVAKFKSEFADFSLLTKREYNKRIENIALEAESKLTKQQTYYMIASGKNISEIEGNPTQPAGKVNELTVEILGDPLAGNEYYELVNDESITGMKKHKQWFSATEKHYITDDGVAFILPGFLEEEEGVYKWWINERSYYIDETGKEGETPEHPDTPDDPDTPNGTDTPDDPENPDGPNSPSGGVTGNKFTINGIDIEIMGDLMEIEIPEDKQGVQVWPGSVLTYEGQFYAAKVEQYLNKDDRLGFLSYGTVIINVDKGATIPSADTVEGDIKVDGEELYVFRPWNQSYGDYDFWKDENLWLKLLKQPVIEFR